MSAPTQPSLFGVEATQPSLLGEALRDAAIDRVEEHAEPDWLAHAAAAIRIAAAAGEFTTDDVWRILDERGLDRPRERRAMGAAMRAARRDGVVEPTDRMRPTSRPEGHRNPKRIWKGTA